MKKILTKREIYKEAKIIAKKNKMPIKLAEAIYYSLACYISNLDKKRIKKA